MCFNLYNPTTSISRTYSRQFWAKALELAKLYDWQPMRTCHPCHEDDWLGTYLTNDSQIVNKVDALWLADSLEKSLEHISDITPKIIWNSQPWIDDDLPEWLSPEEKEIIEEGLQDGLLDVAVIDPREFFAGIEKRNLVQLIRFCKLGSFKIL
jgi:hypothetical protein